MIYLLSCHWAPILCANRDHENLLNGVISQINYRVSVVPFFIGIVTLLTLSACASLKTKQPIVESSDTHEVARVMLVSDYGCEYQSIYKKPISARVPFTVVLGHGYLRSQYNLHDLSEAIVAVGIPVITLDFCAMRLWSGNHQHNSAQMRAVAQHYGVGQVVFAGHSAGALAALAAASSYQLAVGVVLLDFVDDSPIGAEALSNLQLPVTALFGAPSACNANGRDVTLIGQLKHAVIERFDTASHCAFESPSTRWCAWLCADDSTNDSVMRGQIIERVVQALLAFDSISLDNNHEQPKQKHLG